MTVPLLSRLAALAALLAACQAEPPVQLTVLATNDFHGALEASRPSELGKRLIGGHDWILGYFDAVRAENPGGVLLLDAGDMWQGTLVSNLTLGEAVVAFYNVAGYDAVTIGNHEFDFGAGSDPHVGDPRAVLKQRLAQLKAVTIGANIHGRGHPVTPPWPELRPWTIITRKGVRVGLIGLATPETSLTTQPRFVSDLDFASPVETALRLIPTVRRAGATVLILLTHMGADHSDADRAWSGEVVELANELGGEVDLIIGGHTHQVISQRLGGVPVIQAWARGRAFSRADLFVDRDTGRVRTELTRIDEPTLFAQRSLTGGPATYHGVPVVPNPAFSQELRRFTARVEQLHKQVIGRAATLFEDKGPVDTAVGRLVTDALCRALEGAQLCLINRGAIRAGIEAGPITFADVFRVSPFDNTVVLVTLTGREVLATLEHGLSSSYGPMELSGATVVHDAEASPGRRVARVLLADGQPLDPDGFYRVAINDFLYAGGDGYTTFAQGRQVENTHLQVRSLLTDHIRRSPAITADTRSRYVASGARP